MRSRWYTNFTNFYVKKDISVDFYIHISVTL